MTYLPRPDNGTSATLNLIRPQSSIFNGSTGSWSLYKDAAQSSPVDGTGGSPTLSASYSTSSPLFGNGSLVITKAASNLQGEGLSESFTVPAALRAKTLNIEFDYRVDSGTYSAGDLTVYLYDVTNSTVIQPAGYQVLGTTSTISGKHIATFQTSATGATYRLCVHVAVSTTSAFTMSVDNFRVGPQVSNYGTPVTDWQSYSLTIGGATSAPTPGSGTLKAAWWRRVGDSMEIRFEFLQNAAGSAGSGTYKFPLPSGYSIDTTKSVTTGANAAHTFGAGYAYDGTYVYPVTVQYYDNTNLTLFGGGIATANAVAGGQIASTFIPLSNTNARYSFSALIPIVGWSSSLLMSSDADSRVVAACYQTDASQSLSGTAQVIVFEDKVFDTHSGMNTSTGVYTVPVPGYYKIYALITFQSYTWTQGNYITMQVRKNGVQTIYKEKSVEASLTDYLIAEVQDLVYCNAGDTLDVRNEHQAGAGRLLIGTGSQNKITIERIGGNALIATSENVQCRYKVSASTGNSSFADDVVEILDYDTKDFDSHNAVTTGVAWRFTAPMSGVYRVNASIRWANVTNLSDVTLSLYKNGSDYATLTRFDSTAGINNTGTTTIRLLAGEYIDIRAAQNDSTGAARSISTSGSHGYVDIHRIGNY